MQRKLKLLRDCSLVKKFKPKGTSLYDEAKHSTLEDKFF